MDPSSSSCMRSPQPPTLLWGCVRSSHTDLTTAPGLSHYPAAPFSFQQKPDFAAYSDFSASCLVTAPHSFPQQERALVEQHPPFQHSDWHLAATEARRGINPGLALASGESEGSSPSLVSVAADEDDEAPANPTSDSEKKPSKRKKESSGRWYKIRAVVECKRWNESTWWDWELRKKAGEQNISQYLTEETLDCNSTVTILCLFWSLYFTPADLE